MSSPKGKLHGPWAAGMYDTISLTKIHKVRGTNSNVLIINQGDAKLTY